MPLKFSAIFAGATRLLMIGAGAAALVACQQGDGADVAGRPAAGPLIISLNPCLDAILVDVADPAQILALSHYSRDPASSSIPADVVQDFSVTGGTAEEVLALQPQIVLASSFMPQTQRAAFEELGLRVETFGSPRTIAESVEQVTRIGELTGNAAAAARLTDAIAGSAPQYTPETIATLLWQPGQIVPGESTLVGEVMRRSGMLNHAQAMGLQQADYVSLERVLAQPPELLLVAGSSSGQDHPLLARLTKTRVKPLDTHLLYCGAGTIIALQDRLNAIRDEMAE